MIQPGQTILFQGDSITDCGRDRTQQDNANSPGALGHGYALLAAAQLFARFPEGRLTIYNRGISGNEVTDLLDRWFPDCIDMAPDVVSILIGVNDMWRTKDSGKPNTVDQYEEELTNLLNRTRQLMPECKVIVCEPFVLQCGAVTDDWFPEFDDRLGAMRRVSQKFADCIVPFQKMFNELTITVKPDYWAEDGVHPSLAGHQKMAERWVDTVLGD